MSERVFDYGGHWLFKRDDTPNYYIYWYRPGRRSIGRKSTHTADLEEAKRRLIEFADARARPRRGHPDDVSLHAALNDYLEISMAGRPSLEAATYAVAHLARFFDDEGLVFVADLTLDAQDRYVERRRSEHSHTGAQISNGTIARELSVLRAALRAYWKRGFLASAPYIRSVPKPPARERFLRPHEVDRLLDACYGPHLRLFVSMALHTLQRPGAILGLQTSQVNLNDNRIDFLGTVTQSNKRRPVVPITRQLRPLLEEALEFSECGFVIEYDGKPVKSVKKSFANACRQAGLVGVTPYTLRHTGATLLAASGVPLRQIAGMLGHTETKTTEIYAKHAPEYLVNARDQLDRLFDLS